MNAFKIALANLPFPTSADEAVASARKAVADAAEQGAELICFPECFIPGYRTPARKIPPPDPAFLERAWATIARDAKIAAILGTERVVEGKLRISAAVLRDGRMEGFQDKVQLDPSEEATYAPGSGRRIFQCGPMKFGIVICHEGWRYPETVRWAARNGAQIVFHPQFHEADGYAPTTFADPANTFHEKAILCRAAENTCYFASVNYAAAGSPTTSAIARPDGTLLAYQPYGKPGLLLADLDLGAATGLLASRYKPV